ncbi:MAG: hydrogenase iron-sulfur subunit [Pseudomonadota bacterium]
MNKHFEPDVLILYCGRSLADNQRLSETPKKGPGFRARFIMMPCSSKIDPGDLIKLIESGADAVAVVACPEQQCRFLTGSTRAESRVSHARSLLEETGLHGDRLTLVRRSNLSVDEIMAVAGERAGAVRPLGRNPLRGQVSHAGAGEALASHPAAMHGVGEASASRKTGD